MTSGPSGSQSSQAVSVFAALKSGKQPDSVEPSPTLECQVVFRNSTPNTHDMVKESKQQPKPPKSISESTKRSPRVRSRPTSSDKILPSKAGGVKGRGDLQAELAEKLRKAGLDSEAAEVEKKFGDQENSLGVRANTTSEEGPEDEEERDEAEEESDIAILSRLRGAEAGPAEGEESSGSGDKMVEIKSAEVTKADREAEKARVADLLAPFQSSVAALEESPTDSYQRLKAKIGRSLARCEALTSDSKTVASSMQHIEEEYRWWEGRIEAIEKGTIVEGDEAPAWEDLYTTVCRPQTASCPVSTPSCQVFQENIEVCPEVSEVQPQTHEAELTALQTGAPNHRENKRFVRSRGKTNSSSPRHK